jgi:hypothetical protein
LTGEKAPRTYATLKPNILQFCMSGHEIIAAVKPIDNIKRVLFCNIGAVLHALLGIHIQHHRPKRRYVLIIQPVSQCPERPGLIKRIDRDFISIQRQAPVAIGDWRLAHLNFNQASQSIPNRYNLSLWALIQSDASGWEPNSHWCYLCCCC